MYKSLSRPIRHLVTAAMATLLIGAYTVAVYDVTGAAGSGETISVEPLIRVDQIGYLPSSPKVAVISDPQVGFNAGESFVPGNSFEVRRWDDDAAIFSGSPVAWNGGAVHDQSGDRGWWFDFTSVTAAGSYYIYDVANDKRSHQFEIGSDVYGDLMQAALKVFWYQRANVAHPIELGGAWNDTASFVGPGQDTQARSVDDPTNAALERDLSGGWFDAGDTNKYVTFAADPVHQLLSAFTDHPGAFNDAVGIPESGNGIPDVLDEVKWEVDWLKKMQNDDGGVLIKMGNLGHEAALPPSATDNARFYEEVCSSSTIAASAMFAHAAVVYQGSPQLAEEVSDLITRSEDAYDWYLANPVRTDCDNGEVKAGDADWDVAVQQDHQVVAAIYLYSLTNDPSYLQAIDTRLADTSAMTDGGFSRYRPAIGDAVLFYTTLPGSDDSHVAAIEDRVTTMLTWADALKFDANADLYRAHMPDSQHHWGSSLPRANTGATNTSLADFGYGTAQEQAQMRQRAATQLQYFHGVNPLGLTYLSNMAGVGAEKSVDQMFHFWFQDDSDFDSVADDLYGPAPGYVTGGPNAFYPGAMSPPSGQPPQKAYAEFNLASEAEPSWAITEPAIYYQSAYIRLLAGVIHSDASGEQPEPPTPPPPAPSDADCTQGPLLKDWEPAVNNSEAGTLFRIYCGYFLRYPDPAGFTYWRAVRSSGYSFNFISDQFALSDEFQNTYGSLNNSAFVDLMYRNVLGRVADAEGKDYWVRLLETGDLTKGGVMRWATDGEEFKTATGTP